MKFNEKVAVITGAGSGIGRALALNLAQQGCSLALADLNLQGLEETQALLPTTTKSTLHQLDVSRLTDYKSFVQDVVSAHGQVDIVINNAGIVRLHSLEEASYADFEISMAVNVYGVIYGCKEFLPYLTQRSEAWLVNLSSGAGLAGIKNYTSYNTTKFAVRGFTESLRAELSDSNINVSCVHPGGVSTNIQSSGVHAQGAAKSAEKLQSAMTSMTSMTPDKAAKIIVNGMLGRKKRILVGTDVKIVDWLVRLFPASYSRFIAKYV